MTNEPSVAMPDLPSQSILPDPAPSVTVIMAIRNEERSIVRSLGAVLNQEYPAEKLQVLVADGASTDRTRAVIQELAASTTHGPSLTVIDNPQRIVATGLNAAIANASGDIIVRVDGHCVIPPDYIRRCVSTLEVTGADNVGGVAAARGSEPMSAAIASALSSPFGVGGARFRYGGEPGWVDTVPFGTWRRSLLDRLGGFDEELVRNQDDELNLRLIQSGGRIWLDPSIRIEYESRTSLRALGRQYFQYGLYKVRVIQKRRAVASARQLVPAAFVSGLAGAASVSVLTRRMRWISMVVVPYAVGLAAATTALRPASVAVAIRLPAAFATMHLSYGSGFLAGLWRWRNRWGR